MNLLQQAKKISWTHPYRRRTSIHKLDLYVLNMAKEIKRFFRIDFDHLIALGRGLELQWYFDGDQFDALGKAVLKKTIADVRHRPSHINTIKNHAAQGVQLVRGWDRLDLSELSPKQYIKMFHTFSQAIDCIVPILYAPLVIDRGLFKHLREVLGNYYSGKALDKAFEAVITPVVPTPIAQAEIDLCTAKLLARTDTQLFAAAKKYYTKYSWIGMRFVEDLPRGAEYYYSQLKKMSRIRCRQQVKQHMAWSAKAKFKFDHVIITVKPSERRLLRMINQYSLLRHERDLYRNKMYYAGHFFYQSIARRYQVLLTDLLTYSIDEFIHLLQTNKRLTQAEVNRRKKEFVYILTGNRSSLFTDSRSIHAIQRYFMKRSKGSKTNTILHGMGTFPGMTRGRVKIIRLTYVTQDIQSVKEGDILVAESTKPEYLPAMKKAAAVVTNEGGLTCHAAIVSREFKIPTVVGTRIATQVLKNGDKVEVDAKKGVVRKL